MALFDSTFAPYVPFGSRTLSLGDTGTDVAVLQAVYDLMLVTMNPPQGPIGQPVAITGTFDNATLQAVRNIQSYFGLAVTGTVGPATYFVYGQGVGPNTTYGGPVYGSRQLQQGASGGDVLILQNRLNSFRYSSLVGRPADGVFDSATANAVLAFKADAAANGDTGFPNNPIAGFGFFNASWLYTFAGGRGIFTGRNGFDVVFVQVLLKDLGFYSGAITGYYDGATRQAVIAFQQASGIAADGVVGPQTFYQFGLHNPKPAPTPLGISWPPSVPPPKVQRCSTTLLGPGTSNAYGVGSVLLSSGHNSLDVSANVLPDPSLFGSFGAYAFQALAPNGSVLAQVLMVQTASYTAQGASDPLLEDWAGSITLAPGPLPGNGTTFQVFPTPSGSATGPYGPLVLSGTLSGCAF